MLSTPLSSFYLSYPTQLVSTHNKRGSILCRHVRELTTVGAGAGIVAVEALNRVGWGTAIV